MDAATVVSLIAALGIGTWVAKLLEQGSQSRHFRAEALRALLKVEAGRWAPREDGLPGLRSALHDLIAASLIARVPHVVVRQYGYYMRVAWSLSAMSFGEYPDEEAGGGGINSEYADIVRDSARLVTDCIWHPWRTRVSLRRRVRQLDVRASAVANKSVASTLAQFKGYDAAAF